MYDHVNAESNPGWVYALISFAYFIIRCCLFAVLVWVESCENWFFHKLFRFAACEMCVTHHTYTSTF